MSEIEKNLKSNYYIRVITFNLLTQKYSKQSIYPTVKDEYLNFANRSNRVYQLLESWTKVNFIICLQEVDDGWDQTLKEYFQQFDYEYVSELYKNDEMGVGIAYPKNHYELLERDSYKPSNVVRERYTRIKETLNNEEKTKQYVRRYEPSKLKKLANIKLREELGEAGNVELVDNILLSVLLKIKHHGKDTQKRIIVSTYHMPCRYTKRFYMISHVYAVKYYLKTLYDIWQGRYCVDSLIFAGDFNIVPLSSEYRFLTNDVFTDDELNGHDSFIDRIDRVFNEIGYNINDTVKLRSAHKICHNKEPDYTNVCVQHDKKFVDCLDYILITDNIDVKSCIVGLTVSNPYYSAYPNGLCPSDHIPLSASLGIK